MEACSSAAVELATGDGAQDSSVCPSCSRATFGGLIVVVARNRVVRGSEGVANLEGSRDRDFVVIGYPLGGGAG